MKSGTNTSLGALFGGLRRPGRTVAVDEEPELPAAARLPESTPLAPGSMATLRMSRVWTTVNWANASPASAEVSVSRANGQALAVTATGSFWANVNWGDEVEEAADGWAVGTFVRRFGFG